MLFLLEDVGASDSLTLAVAGLSFAHTAICTTVPGLVHVLDFVLFCWQEYLPLIALVFSRRLLVQTEK